MVSLRIDVERLADLIADRVAERLANKQSAAGSVGEPLRDEGYLNRKEVAQMLRISLATVDRLTHRGSLPSVKLGGRVVYSKTEVQAAVASLPYDSNNC